jgi:hypothetical protein
MSGAHRTWIFCTLWHGDVSEITKPLLTDGLISEGKKYGKHLFTVNEFFVFHLELFTCNHTKILCFFHRKIILATIIKIYITESGTTRSVSIPFFQDVLVIRDKFENNNNIKQYLTEREYCGYFKKYTRHHTFINYLAICIFPALPLGALELKEH